MKKVIEGISIILFALVLFMGAGNIQENQGENRAEEVVIETIDQSIITEDGLRVARIYYDKPVLPEDSAITKKINEFFEKEAEQWLTGKPNRLTAFYDDYLEMFLSWVDDDRARFGDGEMVQSPDTYTIDTKVMLYNDKYLSVMQVKNVYGGGPRYPYYYGSTFDLETGELLPMDAIIPVDVKMLKEGIGKTLKKEINYNFLDEDQWEYKYFYDGEYIYIIFNGILFEDGSNINSGFLVKWNGKYGAEYEASTMEYKVIDDHVIKESEEQ